MDAHVVIDQDGKEEAINRGREFIIAPEIEELHLMGYVHVGLTINLPIAKTLAKSLKNHKALKDFGIDSHLLCAESARWVCGALATIKTLRTLGFADTFTNPEAMKWVTELVKVKPELTMLNIDEHQPLFSYPDAKDLFVALENCKKLESLIIRSSALGKNEAALEAMGNFLKRNNSIRTLTIGLKSATDSWSDTGLAKVLDGIAENRSIVRLKLLNLAMIGELSCKRLARCLRRNQNIIELDLNGCSITENQLVPIIESIMVNDSIGHLTLVAYQFREKGFKILAKYLRQTKFLQFLQLTNATEGLSYFWEGLKHNTTLDILSMHGAPHGTWPFAEIQKIVWMHPRLTALGWSGFYMEPTHPLTQKLMDNKEKFRNTRKEVLFSVFMLAKSARKFPTEIWSMIMYHVLVPSTKHNARADKLFDCIIRHWDQIAQCLEQGQPFKIIQQMKHFTFEEEM
jgi:hypothetical protein